jgi:hypothetical protein
LTSKASNRSKECSRKLRGPLKDASSGLLCTVHTQKELEEQPVQVDAF